MHLRDALDHELDAVARLRFDAWQDAHAAMLPKALRRIRTLGNFCERLAAASTSVKCGWRRVGEMIHRLPVRGGVFGLRGWRYQKRRVA